MGVYMDMNGRMATTAHLLSGGNVHYLSDDEVRLRNTSRPALPQAPPPPNPASAAKGGLVRPNRRAGRLTLTRAEAYNRANEY